MSLAQLKARLAQVVPAPPPQVAPVPTGISALDEALGGGLPRGRMTELVGPLGAGTITITRTLVATTLARGEGVACIDASRTFDPADWASLDCEHFRLVRPHEPARGPWCADVLLRSGAFALVVLDGAPPLSRQTALRLVGLVRDKNVTFVVVGEGSVTQLGGAVRLEVKRRWGSGRHADRRLATAAPPSASLHLQIVHGGPRSSIEIEHVIHRPRRLLAHPEVPDRRGVAGAHDKRWKGARNGGQVPGGR
jgi:hypothetical protein